jgi:hypothetical protein
VMTLLLMYLQQDGAPPHLSRQVTDLHDTYSGRWIGRGMSVACPSRSHLNPLDFYLWDNMKSLVYEEKTNNRDALLHRVLDAAERILYTPDLFVRTTTTSLPHRATWFIAVVGPQFEHSL